jgi:predicted Zn-dependent protease
MPFPSRLAARHRLLLSSAALLLSACNSLQAQTPGTGMTPTDNATLQRALSAYDAGDFTQAEPLLRALATRYRSSFDANEALGSLYAEKGDLAAALPFLERATTLAPRRAIAHANLGAALLKQNHLPHAVIELQTAAQLDPQDQQTQSNLGHALFQAGQPAAAARAFSAARLLSTSDPELAAELIYDEALADYQAGEFPQAALLLGTLAPDSMTAADQSLAADTDEKLAHYKDALLHYQAAAHLEPSAANLYALAVELLRHWTWDEALKVAAYGEQRYPQDQRFPFAQGVALYADGKYTPAVAIFSSLLAQYPENETYAALLGRSCNAIDTSGADADANHCAALQTFAESHPHNAEVATYAAKRILEQPAGEQNSAEADRLLHQAIAADPQLAQAWFQLGVLAQQQQKWQQSTVALEKAVALAPSDPEAHYRLSRAYSHLGRKDEAQQQMQLHQQDADEQKTALNARLQDVVTFLLKAK